MKKFYLIITLLFLFLINAEVFSQCGVSLSASVTVITCTNPISTLTATATNTNGAITYSWSAGATGSGSTATIITAGTYTVTITDATPCTATQSVTVAIDTISPTVVAGNPFTKTCSNNTNGKAIGEVNTAGTTYSWSPAAGLSSSTVSNPLANPIITTTYTVTKTKTSNGCTKSATVIVTVNTTPPIANAGSPFTKTCLLNSNGLIIGEPGVTGNTYLWSPATGLSSSTLSNPLANPAATTTYTVTKTKTGNGCTASATTTVTVNANPPNVNASALPGSVCKGDTAILTAGGNATSYSWMPGSLPGTTVSVSPALTTTYTVTGTATNGCTATATVLLTVNLLPTATITPVKDSVCINAASASITFTGSNGTKPYTFTYKINGGSNQTVTVVNSNDTSISVSTAIAGTFVYQLIAVSDNNGCTQAASGISIITVNPLPMVAITGATTFCPGGSTTLDAGNHDIYSWSNGAASQSVNVIASGTYTVTVTDLSCTASTSVIVNSVSLSTVIQPASPSVCADSPLQLNTNSTGGGGIYTYTWTSTGTLSSTTISNPIFNASVAGVYNVTVTISDGGCTASASETINVNTLPTAAISGNATVCKNSTQPIVTFAGLLGAPNFTFTYSIFNGSTTTLYNVTTSGVSDSVTVNVPTGITGTYIYTLILVQDGNGCSQVISGQSATVTVNEFPSPVITGNVSFCPGGSTTLEADSFPTYLWSNGATIQTINVSLAGTYTVTVTDLIGCTGTASVMVSQIPLTMSITPSSPTVCAEEDLQLNANLSGGSGSYTYVWTGTGAGSLDSITIANPVFNDSTPGSYGVTVSVSDGGCIVSDTVNIEVNLLPVATIKVVKGDSIVCLNAAEPKIKFFGSLGTAPYTFTYNIIKDTVVIVTDIISTNGIDTAVTLNASTDSVGTFIYQLVSVEDSKGCLRLDSDSVTIIVNPLPSATLDTTTLSVCQGTTPLSVIFTGKLGTPPYQFIYILNGVADTVSTLNGFDTVSVSALTATVGIYSYILFSVSDANGCEKNVTVKNKKNIIVNSLPNSTISGTTNVCQNDSTPTITFTGTNGTPPYIFTYTLNGDTLIDSTLSGTGNNSISISNPTNVSDTFVYQLVSVIDSNGCTQPVTNQSATVIVNTLPTAIILGDTAVCKSSLSPLVTFVADSGAVPYTFIYSIDDGINPLDTDTIVTGGSNIVSMAVSTASTGIFVYSLISVSDGNDCAQNVTGQSVTITVNPLPTATISVNDTVVCQNDAALPVVTFTGANGTQNYTFNYTINGVPQSSVTSSGGSIATVNAPSIVTGQFIYTLISVSDSNGCSQNISAQSVTINVKPLPTATINGTDAVCLNDTQLPLITFTGANGTQNYTFTYSLFDGTNTTTNSVQSSSSNIATVAAPTTFAGTFVYTIISVTDGNGCSQTVTGQSATITVNPLPTAFISGNATVCKDGPLQYVTFTGSNGTPNYTFTYTINGTQQPTVTSSGSSIVTVPVSTNVAGVFVYDLISVSDANGCTQSVSGQSVTIIVNTLPTAAISGTFNVCLNDPQPLITFTGTSGAQPYTFNYNINNGNTQTVTTSGGSNTATAAAPTDLADSFTYTLLTVSDGNGCSSQLISGQTATITVNNAPIKPLITSIINYGDTICEGTSSINFNVNNVIPNTIYEWSAIGDATFQNSLTANTVIDFGTTPGQVIITVTAKDSALLPCTNADTFIVNISTSNNSIIERAIIAKEPGHLLVYPDNSMATDSGYQWGYDTLTYINSFNDTISGPPIDIPGQVYPVFIPAIQFIKNDSLNEHDYAYWVLLKNGECISKVYYNGPYANRPIPVEPTDNTVGVSVYPNPTAGDMNILLRGKIYGNIDAKIYNALGQTVYRTHFEKKQPEIIHKINLNKIPEGVYMLELISSNHQKVTTRIIVYH